MHRWAALAAGLVFAVVGGAWGTGVFSSLVNGGFVDPEDTGEYEAVRDHLLAPGLRTQFAGGAALTADITDRVGRDIARAETYSMPILMCCSSSSSARSSRSPSPA